ncbi:MAG: Ig-like domain-containing protein [Candidatus Lernaella stagnicola]|nr:Ig-like domain-containing protein [Candidatus Lernaella stagnicola]
MNKQLDRWVRLIALLVLLAIMFAPVIGCDENDENDTSGDDDDTLDDADDDTIDDDDDTTGDDDTAAVVVELVPDSEMLPVGASENFVALVTYPDDTTAQNPAEIVWTTADETVATVAGGSVTGVGSGVTTLVATLGDAEASAPVYVAPDVFAFDLFTGTIDTIDRIAQTFTVDAFAAGAYAAVPNRIFALEGILYVTDSGDFGAGIVGEEKLVAIDAVDGAATTVTLDMDSPWATTAYDGMFYTAGNLSDQLALITSTGTVNYVDLPAGCVPVDLVGAAGKIYVSCSGFDGASYGDFVAVYDLATESVTEITLAAGQNPGAIVATWDEANVYVVATGNYVDVLGAVNKIDTAADTVVSSFDLGTSPGGAALSWFNDVLFVLDGVNMYAIDTADGDAILRGPDDPIIVGDEGAWLSAIHVHDDTANVYVANQNYTSFVNEIEVYDGDTFAFLQSYDISASGSSPGGIASW